MLLLVAIIIFACVFLNNLSSKIGVPYLLAFIVLGMIFGSDGILRIPFDDFNVAKNICSAALIFIMFYGGFGTSWKHARKVSVPAVLLASAGVVITALITGIFCRYALRFSWIESFLMGSVVSSTDAASVFSILRSRRLELKNNTSSLLEVESGSNDPASYMLTLIFIRLLNAADGTDAIVKLIGSQIVFGLGIAVVTSLAARYILRKFNFANEGFNLVFVTGIAVISYAASEVIGGNGYLSTYLCGLIIGNSAIPEKKELVHYFIGVTNFCQMLIFFLLGLLSFPSMLPQAALSGLLVAGFLLFWARPAAVFAIGKVFSMKARQILTICWAGLRGASSIVFAIMAMTETNIAHDFFHIVFVIVLASILIQGSLLPLVARKLDMIDYSGNVMKSFTDYAKESPVEFIRTSIPEGHPWVGKKIHELLMAPETLIIMIKRNDARLIPSGSSVLKEGDDLVLAAPSAKGTKSLDITEIMIEENDESIGKRIRDLDFQDALIIMIFRDEQSIIPHGNTKIHANDLLVLHHQSRKQK